MTINRRASLSLSLTLAAEQTICVHFRDWQRVAARRALKAELVVESVDRVRSKESASRHRLTAPSW